MASAADKTLKAFADPAETKVLGVRVVMQGVSAHERTVRAFVVAELPVLVGFDREASGHSLAVPQSETVTVVVTAPDVTTGTGEGFGSVVLATSSAGRVSKGSRCEVTDSMDARHSPPVVISAAVKAKSAAAPKAIMLRILIAGEGVRGLICSLD